MFTICLFTLFFALCADATSFLQRVHKNLTSHVSGMPSRFSVTALLNIWVSARLLTRSTLLTRSSLFILFTITVHTHRSAQTISVQAPHLHYLSVPQGAYTSQMGIVLIVKLCNFCFDYKFNFVSQEMSVRKAAMITSVAT